MLPTARRWATFTFTLGGVVLGGCHPPDRPRNAPTPSRTITDMSGRAVTLPARVDRIASNGGAIDQWLLMLGAAPKMVATSEMNRANPLITRIFPGIAKLPTPLLSTGIVNIEELLRAKPDVFFMLSGLKAQGAIEKSGIPVVVFERRDHAELSAAVRLAGRILGPTEQAAAEAFCAYYDGAIARVTARTGHLPAERRVKVYYGGSNPLSTEGRHTMVEDWITSAGGVDVAAQAGLEGMGKQVSIESVLRWDPDVIIVGDRAAQQKILQDAQWKNLRAVRDRKVFVNPKGIYLWSVRSAEAALQVLWSARAIHPELFPALDMVKETRGFYQRFYRYRLSDREVTDILEPPGR